MRAVNSLTISSAVTGSPSIAPRRRRSGPSSTLPTMPTARLNGIDVYYERRGDGPPVLFLNGSGVDARRHARPARRVRRPGRPPRPRPARASAGPRSRPGRTRWPTTRPTPSRCSTTSDGTGRGWSGISFGGMVAQELAVTAARAGREARAAVHLAGWRRCRRYPLHEIAGLGRRRARRARTSRSSTPASPATGSPTTTRTAALVEMLAARQLGREVGRGAARRGRAARGARRPRRARPPRRR